MFIKHGEGKIMSVLEVEELTEEQKKASQKLARLNKQLSSDDKTQHNKQES